jgi:RND family efflux transporter MFP subunit
MESGCMNIFCRNRSSLIAFFITIAVNVLFLSAPCLLFAAETFLEPNQYIDIRSPFQVTVQAVCVEEGQTVEKDDLLIELDSQILQAREQLLVEVASFHGVLDSAGAMLKMQQDRLRMVEKLSKSGNIRRKELEKVKTDLAVSRAKLLEAQEGQKRTLLELQIARTQVEERRLKSPVLAVVLKIYKQPSEMASPTDPDPVISLVQLDPLLAVFHLPVLQARMLTKGDTVSLLMGDKEVQASVEFVSPVIEAQSGTIRVRFRVANPDGILLSGSRVSYEP